MSFSEWEEVKLGEVANVLSGYAFKSKDFCNNGIPVIKIKNITPPYISLDDVQYVSHELSEEKSRYKLKYNDVLISLTGSNVNQFASAVGKVGRIKINKPMMLNQRVGKFEILDQSVYDLNFLYYLISTEEMHYKLAINAGGAANQANISPSMIKNIDLPYPPIDEQKAIAATLSCLDDKIELNNRINKTLEEMAQAIFKSWFVDFEPFRDGEFEDSELGRIPKGWKVGTISDLGDVVGGSTPSKDRAEYYTDEGTSWITPKDLSNNKDKFISKGEIDITDLGLRNSSTKVMPKGTVLFSSRAPIGYIAIAKNDVTTNQGFKSVVPKSNIDTAYVYYFLKNNIDIIENRASGSTFKEVSGSVMKQIPALIPNDNALMNFQDICGLYFEKQMLLENQNQTFMDIRDALLPKLMSGEIRIPVEEVQ